MKNHKLIIIIALIINYYGFSIAQEIGSPSPANNTIQFTDEYPEYVFDVIPFYWQDELHVFYLNGVFNENRVRTGIKWSHVKTKDMVHWLKLPDAVMPGQGENPPDPNIWTGSVIEKDGTFYLFYTGKSIPGKEDPKGDQKAMLATSTDLIHFEKKEDFVLYADGEYYWNKNINGPLDPSLKIHNQRDESFRDPEVFWNEEAGEYWMLLHSRDAETQKHVFGLYRSDDLLNWEPRSPLKTPNDEMHRRNIDCPDLFKLGDKWVLIFSGFRYAIADDIEGPYSKHRSYENNYFVPKTAELPDGRVLTVGTIRAQREYLDSIPKTQGPGKLSMVREFYFGPDHLLLQKPVQPVVDYFSEVNLNERDLINNLTQKNGKEKNGKIVLSAKKQKKPVVIDFPDAPSDFLADFTLIPDKSTEFTFRFRTNKNQEETGYYFYLNTSKQQIRIGNEYHHSDTNKGYAERDISFKPGEPVKVQLFMYAEVITCFVEDVCTLTMNAHDIEKGDILLELSSGKAEFLDFNIRTNKK